FLSVFCDVVSRELDQVWRFAKTDLPGFFFGGFNSPTVPEHSTNHPKRADSNRGGAVDEHRAVSGIVGYLEELRRLFILRVTVDNRNVEVLEAKFFCLCFFVGGAMLTRRSQIDDRLHAFGFQFLECLDLRLPARAILITHASEVEYARLLRLNLRVRRHDQHRGSQGYAKLFHNARLLGL